MHLDAIPVSLPVCFPRIVFDIAFTPEHREVALCGYRRPACGDCEGSISEFAMAYVSGQCSMQRPRGGLKWHTSAMGSGNYNIMAPAVGPDGTVYVTVSVGTTSTSYALFALNGQTGSISWYSTIIGTYYTPAVSSTVIVYVIGNVTSTNPDTGNYLYAFNGQSGALLLQAPFTIQPGGNPWIGSAAPPTIASDGTVYTFNNAFNGTTGAVNWSSPLLIAPPAIASIPSLSFK